MALHKKLWHGIERRTLAFLRRQYAPFPLDPLPRSRGDGEKFVVGFAHTEQGFALHPRMQMSTQKTQRLSSRTLKAVQGAALQTQFPRPRVSGAE